jgi:hypothetical protein
MRELARGIVVMRVQGRELSRQISRMRIKNMCHGTEVSPALPEMPVYSTERSMAHTQGQAFLRPEVQRPRSFAESSDLGNCGVHLRCITSNFATKEKSQSRMRTQSFAILKAAYFENTKSSTGTSALEGQH